LKLKFQCHFFDLSLEACNHQQDNIQKIRINSSKWLLVRLLLLRKLKPKLPKGTSAPCKSQYAGNHLLMKESETVIHQAELSQQETYAPLEIDQSAKRLSDTVRREIYNFFEQGRFGLEGHHVNKGQKE
jgi:hypothetical protein